MSFGGEYHVLAASSLVQGMVLCEEQVQILGRFAEKETFHSISLLAIDDIAQVRPTTSSPTSAPDVPKRHFADVEVVWISRCLVQIISALDEFRSACPVLEVMVNIASWSSNRSGVRWR